MAISSQSAERVVRDVHDEADQALRVKITGSAGVIDVNVNAALDSIALADAGGAGNPWSALLADNADPDTFGERVQKLLTKNQFLGLK